MTPDTQAQEGVVHDLLHQHLEQQEKIPPAFDGPRQKVIVISGPTGVGKSATAETIASMIGGEIISADSMQVYRGMDIGTAKPSREEQERVPHHLVDVRDVDTIYNVVDYYYDSRQACESALARNRVPILVGGSGFYIHSFIYGPPSGPPSVPALRQEIEEEIDRLGPELMYDKLVQLDPAYAKTITANDRQKIARAFEIMKLTERPVSSLDWRQRMPPADYDLRCWFLYRPKDVLYRRIDERCDQMVERGLVEEVKALKEKGLLSNTSACQAIGYRQTLDYLDSEQTEADFQKYLRVFKQASRRYAKRQFTWFRKEPLFRWLDIELHDIETAIDMIICDYNSL